MCNFILFLGLVNFCVSMFNFSWVAIQLLLYYCLGHFGLFDFSYLTLLVLLLVFLFVLLLVSYALLFGSSC